ncbi:hypothetical protein GQ57_24895 [Burkholderia sp. MSh2]|uniref:Uncharacterized protein n=1 Tax=Burkholderia paludis TaxID=1506587 RepID=A0A6J5DLH9_9BURK|nr:MULTISPECIES: hypothetical protein [Burkholderia]KEZ03253.1 hypothetical protein GQ57_24895 [Burkholderia sp. MSh2]KFG95300.1 hypothetical protein GQ56_0121280 [Burkholderia paludis]CAB3754948.1 hypothetical protein LMG30113_02330 [Burkholderia paludis]VWB33671.1 hypothetical protein BPA30113_01322 [Burkholderia paludis]
MPAPTISLVRSFAISSCPPDLPRPGDLLLWRLRADWQLMTREQGHARLSSIELRRARTHPNRLSGRRYAIERSALRTILGIMTDRAPQTLPLVDLAAGRVGFAECDAFNTTSAAIAQAGIWIVIAITHGPVGLGILQHGAPGDPASRMQVRRESVEHACGHARQAAIDIQPVPHQSLFRAETPDGGNWNLLDVPMTGSMYAATVAAPRIERVHAIGWHGESDAWSA